ncbi:MAG TPA: HlyD family efflux transporter periplasmic adaptor subunit [Opitutaceae bacterium]|jgi:HlyD family secretion protein|nr:HlyD family efflux transporter periplasmic adaptor subunit [Opitutaceae bacterium]
MSNRRLSTPRNALFLALAAASLLGCSRGGTKSWQGYLEGDFVYVSSPLSGRLEKLSVAKGTRVRVGAPLFELEHVSESDAQRQAGQQLDAAKALLMDMSKGQRQEEIDALAARLAASRATAENSRLELERQDALFRANAITASDHDRARLVHDADQAAVDEASARLATARLGSRPDAVIAAGATVRAAADAVAKARWSVEQKAQAAPSDALVYDTLYRVGEFVTAGNPVVALLPAANIKVRFFVGEGDFARLKNGDHVSVSVEGHDGALDGTVDYLSPQPEYTPPVLYNRDNRSKLVYMAEAVFPADVAADLHPGQPVDVSLPRR